MGKLEELMMSVGKTIDSINQKTDVLEENIVSLRNQLTASQALAAKYREALGEIVNKIHDAQKECGIDATLSGARIQEIDTIAREAIKETGEEGKENANQS